ncbi:hypothetical protein FQN55_008264 [Onygenales sp. PD_40]|nr:hypothetical protein FQN55_008264 [Onygenales sp. PD_40]KAK2785498.1 hypothetical protein FQN52_008409 [Onygenales sp. PD_12]
MAAPSPLHRHQSSLERIINFPPHARLPEAQRIRAQTVFYSIIDHFNLSDDESCSKYKRPLLVRYTYEYSRSDTSRDTFLRAFTESMELDITDEALDINWDDKGIEDKLRSKLMEFSDFLLDNFFLPLKASSKRTPQPSPAHLSAVQRALGGAQDYTGTPERISTLHTLCLIRDRHRCVVSRKFNVKEAAERLSQDMNAQDEEGNPLREQAFDVLEAAHILPHALMQVDKDLKLDKSKNAALSILDMFDVGVTRLIEGAEIDRPFNAISLTPLLRTCLGNFDIFFEPVPDHPPHTYRIDTFLPAVVLRDLPVTRTLFTTSDRTIDPPSPRLLAIHSAIAHILHLSAAGEYINKILSDMEKIATQEDGSTELGRLVGLGLGGWFDGSIDAFA